MTKLGLISYLLMLSAISGLWVTNRNMHKQYLTTLISNAQEVAECNLRLSAANIELTRQNSLVEQYKLESSTADATHKSELDRLQKKYELRKQEIVTVLKSDPTCEHELEVIKQDQRGVFNFLERM